MSLKAREALRDQPFWTNELVPWMKTGTWLDQAPIGWKNCRGSLTPFEE